MAKPLIEQLRDKSRDALETLEKTEQGGKKKKAKKKAPKEKIGTGKPSFDLGGAIKEIRARQAATDDPALKAKLDARIKAMRANQ